jgi:hypothetical protein
MRSNVLELASLNEVIKLNKDAYGFAGTYSGRPAKGHDLINLRQLGLSPVLSGAEQGTNTAGDVVQYTTDGRDISELWTEFQATLSVWNEHRQRIVDFLTFPVVNVIDDVPQGGTSDFEEASEFGEPKGQRNTLNYFSLAYDFRWYDLATRMTWKFLADATAAQVTALHGQALEADNRLIFNKVMKTIYNNVNTKTDIRNQPYTVYRLYNNDGTVPPTYGSNVFDGTHTHYTTSGAATIDSGDVEALEGQLTEHGFSAVNGNRLVLMVNSQQGAQIRRFRANVVNNNAAVALYDFVPAIGQPAMIVPNTTGLIGQQVAGDLDGLNVIGSYGNFIIVQDDYLPAGYILGFATGGAAQLSNPVGFREHANAGLRGLRLMPGNMNGYPLQDSFYSRGFGTGIRQRGGAAVMQITASGTYAVPSVYA